MGQNVILYVWGRDLERTRLFVKINNILHCNPYPAQVYTREVSLKHYNQFFWKTGAQIDHITNVVGERKKGIKEKPFVQVDTL